MKVLVLSNNQFQQKNIPNNLDSFREIVGGYIEIPYITNELHKNGIDIIINENGKLINGMKKEIAIVDKNTGRVLDVVFGNCIFASHNEYGNSIGLIENQIEIVHKLFDKSAMMNDKSIVRVLYV